MKWWESYKKVDQYEFLEGVLLGLVALGLPTILEEGAPLMQSNN